MTSPAVLRVRSGCASASVRLQRVGLSSCDAETGVHSTHTPRSGAALGAVAMPAVVWRWTGGRGEWGAAGGLVCF